MSKWEKLLEKIRNNPKTVTFDEVDKGHEPYVKEEYVKLIIEVMDED